MIPKIIWQTYKTAFPPLEAVSSIRSWLDKNPEYQWYYFDDERCRRFIQDHFTEEFYQMYISLPIGVMKSDVWRIAVVYIYGGVYADLDTLCIQPIDSWTQDQDLVVSVEPPTVDSIANFCFAAKPKHPALKLCLENILKNYNCRNYLDKIERTGTPIQNFGQEAFHSGIQAYLAANPDDDTAKKYTLEENAFTPGGNDHTLVLHQIGSVHWNNYDSWRHEQQRMFGY